MPRTEFPCDVEECQGVSTTGVYCEMHRRRFRAYGTPTPLKVCFECKREFVWVDKSFTFSVTKDHTAKMVACRDCVSFFFIYSEYLPRNRGGVRKHGLSVTDYVNLLVAQGFKCALCDREPTSWHRMSIDHDHSCCNKAHGCKNCIRGLVCLSCNALLGHLETKENLIALYEKEYKYSRPFKEGR